MSPLPLPFGIRFIVGFYVFYTVLWIFAQVGAILDYDRVSRWRLQEPRGLAEEAVVQGNRANAVADTVVMLPLLLFAIYGMARRKFYGAVASWLVLGTTLYWPVAFWASRYTYASADIKCISLNAQDQVTMIVFFLFGTWGTWYQYRSPVIFSWWQRDMAPEPPNFGKNSAGKNE